LPGAPDLSSFNENLSAFQYNRKSNFFAECTKIAHASAPRKYGVEFVYEKVSSDFGSGFVVISIIGASLNVF